MFFKKLSANRLLCHLPYSVPDALERAETLCAFWAFARVVISLQERSLWRDGWGTLAEFPGYA
jgi:hypothetical protein